MAFKVLKVFRVNVGSGPIHNGWFFDARYLLYTPGSSSKLYFDYIMTWSFFYSHLSCAYVHGWT